MLEVLDALGPALGAYLKACEARARAVAAGLDVGPFDVAVDAAGDVLASLAPARPFGTDAPAGAF